MPKVRIVDPKSGFKLWLPLPYKLFINLFLRRSIVLNVIDGRIKGLINEAAQCTADEDQQKMLIEQNIRLMQTLWAVADAFDFGELRHALTNTAAYRGLVLIDIQATDGTIVQITL